MVAVVFVFGVIVYAPHSTTTGSLVLRSLGGLVGAILVVNVVWRSVRSFAQPQAPVPESVDAREAEIVYECSQCGTRLRLEVASTGKAPRHCGEEMDATLA